MPTPASLAAPKLFDLLSLLPNSRLGKLMRPAVPVVERALRLNTVNALYQYASSSGDLAFVENGLGALGVNTRVQASDLDRIPRSGPVVAVANHPFGLLDPMIVLSVLRRVRPDLKVLTNRMLATIPELAPLCIFVDPFGTARSTRSNVAPLKETLRWLHGGGLLLVFPAGEVASFQLKSRAVEEPCWNAIVSGLIRRTSATTLPVFVNGTNGPAWHLAGLVHPRLRTALLPRELVNKRSRQIDVHIGNALPPTRLGQWSDDAALVAHLRERVLNLRHRRRAVVLPTLNAPSALIRAAECPRQMEVEIARLAPSCRLAAGEGLTAYLATAREIPATLREIGRQREIAFRAIGEGTGKELDLDRYDEHYLHLFLWNERTREIAGGYRLGPTDQILPRHGAHGLYTTSLFHLDRPLLDRLTPALELGRSFVRREYQKTTSALALLWKGIGAYVAANPRYRQLFGPVSISGDYRPGSQELMIRFLRENCSENGRRQLVRGRHPVRLKGRMTLPPGCDLNEVNHRVADIETDEKGVPVLVRQYLSLGGRILGFNVDPAFNHSIDVMIVVDLLRTDPRMLSRFIGRAEMQSFRAAHTA